MKHLRQYIRMLVEECSKDKYWGVGGAGMVFVCQEDETVFLQKRGAYVTGGAGQWAFPGGGIHPEEARWESHYDTPIDEEYVLSPNDPVFLETAQEEVIEEVGSIPRYKVIDSYIYEDCGFIYKTFIADVSLVTKEGWSAVPPEEAAWETAGLGWFTKEEFLRQDLFFGFTKGLINKVLLAIG